MKIHFTIPDSVNAKLKGYISRGIAAVEVDENGHLIITLTDGAVEDLGKVSGDDGVSVTHEWDGTVLRVTSASGTSEADLKGDKGSDGAPGKDGSVGKDGVSATHEWNGTTLVVTSASGTSSADLKGETGSAGKDGAAGSDGVSPTITVENISGGHRLIITDATGTKTVDVMDGADGDGSGDMRAAVYDPTNKAQDIFAYVDAAVAGAVFEEDIDAAVTEALEEAKASGEFDGADGQDGVSVTHSWNGTTLTVTSASGTSSADLKGDTGADGAEGVGIASVQQTTTSTADDGNNIITVTLTDGTTHAFTVQNGSKGSAGQDGVAGSDGADGKDGSDGVSCTHRWNGTTLTVTSASGTSSADLKGADGAEGADGKSAYQAAVEGGYGGTEAGLNAALAAVPSHINDTTKHITAAERTAWNAKQPAGNYAKTDTANTYNGEQKFANAEYCPTITDSASGVGCAFKASRGLANEMLVDKLIMTASTGKIPFYKYTGTSAGSMTGLTEVAAIDTAGALSCGTLQPEKIENLSETLYIYGKPTIGLYQTDGSAVQNGVDISYDSANNTRYMRPISVAAGEFTLGTDSRRFKTAYFTTAANVSSDRSIKENVKEIDERYIEFFDKLEPVSYELIGHRHDRVHLGFISQDVKTAMDEVGLTDLDFGGYCRDAKLDPVTDEPILDEDGSPVYSYSLRYGEFIALNSKMIQLCRETIKTQQAEIDTLKNELAELKSMVKAITDGEG